MTTQFAVLKNLPAGLTFTSAKLFAVSAPDTVLTGNTFSFSNRTNATSQYVVSIDRSPTALPAGDYTLIAYIGTAPRAELNCTFAGTDGETATDTPEVAELNTEGREAIAAAVDAELSDTHGDGSWEGGGGAGGGSPVFTAVVVARIATGTAAGWPEDLTIGDAYLTENAGAQPLFIKDVADNILSGLGTKNFADADFVATLRLAPLTDGTRTLDTPPTTIEVKSTDPTGIVYNDDTAGAEYFELQIPRAKTLLGVTKTKYSCQFIMNWGDDETFERTVNLGEIKFIRKNAPAT